MQLAYLLFRYHHILPSKVEGMSQGERMVVHAFMHYEMDARNKEIGTLMGEE